jgi:hypothetical protein
VLSHADRTRILSEPHRKRLFTRNGVIPGTVLVSGFVAGSWRITAERGATALVMQPYAALSRGDLDAIAAEGERLLNFAYPAADTRDIRVCDVEPR